MSTQPPQQDRPALAPQAPSALPAARTLTRRLTSEQLFAGGAVEVEIEHQQQVYRLRRTSLGKLILTK